VDINAIRVFGFMTKFFKFSLIALFSVSGLVALAGWALSSYHTTQSSQPVWSPNSRSLLFIGYGKLYKVNVDGTGLRPIAEVPRGGDFFDAQWSPDSKSLAWLSRHNSAHDEVFPVDTPAFPILRVIKPDGSSLSQAFHKIGYFQWTSAQQLIFTTDYGEIPQRFYQTNITNAQTHSLKQLEAFNHNGDFYPARHFSPDGQRLAIASEQGITVINLDGSNRVQLVPGKDVLISSWSPDSQRILYRDRSPENGDTWLVNADGSGTPQRLDREVDEYRGTWSPDGRWILLQEGNFAEPRSLALWLIDATGKQPSRKLAEGKSGVWSPDSRQIAFICRPKPGEDLRSLCVIQADGTGLKNLGYDTQSVAWSPQGQQLAFVDQTQQGKQLTVMNADGAGMRRLSPDHWFQFCVGSVCF
jgi:Tol biopolymer transport system component